MKRNEKTTRKENNIDVDNTPLSPTSKITKCLKEFEGNFISKINEQAKNAKRDLNMKSNHLTLLEKRLNKKANELDVREGQLNLAQQELEIKRLTGIIMDLKASSYFESPQKIVEKVRRINL